MIPIPINWVVDGASAVAGAAGDAFEALIKGLVGWVVDALVWIVSGIFNFFMDAQDPNVQADWFITGDGPYATTAKIGATLMVLFLLAGIVQGVVTGDVGGMLRRMAVDLPISVLGIVGLVTFTQTLVRLTDDLSTWVMGSFEEDLADFTSVVVSVASLAGVSMSFLLLLLGTVTILAGTILVAELAVRAALVYIVVALAPLVFAARLWPALQATCRKLLELLCALIVSKLVMAVSLAVAAAASVGSGSGGEVTSLPEPEVVAEDPGGSVTQGVGILLAAGAAFGVAAFAPLLVAKLFPLTEAAMAAHGIRSGPTRAGQQVLSTAYSVDILSQGRLRQLASGGLSGGGRGRGGPQGGGDGGDGPTGGGSGCGLRPPFRPGPPGAGAPVRGRSGGRAAGGGAARAGTGPAGAAVAAGSAAKDAAKTGAQTATGAASAVAGGSSGGAAGASGGAGRGARPVKNRDEPVGKPHGRSVANEEVAAPPPWQSQPSHPSRRSPSPPSRRPKPPPPRGRGSGS